MSQACELTASRFNADSWMPSVGKNKSSITPNKPLDLVKYTSDANVWLCTYIFALKDSGTKARIVGKGCRQFRRVEYSEIHAPVVRCVSSSLRSPRMTSSCARWMSSLRSCTLTFATTSIWRSNLAPKTCLGLILRAKLRKVL